MKTLSLPTWACFICILKTCYAIDLPHIEGGITGNVLEFNCSTGQIPLGQTVEIVTNGKSQFMMAHFNTTCIQKHIKCKPSHCSCTSHWFQWKMEIENPTITLKVQCLMRYPENKRDTVKATIAFNGSYFWDYTTYQTLTTQGINVATTTKVASDTNDKSGFLSVIIIVPVALSILFTSVVIISSWHIRNRIRRRNRNSAPPVSAAGDRSSRHLHDSRNGSRRDVSLNVEMTTRSRYQAEPVPLNNPVNMRSLMKHTETDCP